MEIIKNGFTNERLGVALDVYIINGKEWFKARDISDYLGCRDSNDMTKYIDSIEENSIKYNDVTSQGNSYKATFINSTAFSCVIQKSRKINVKLKKELLSSLGLYVLPVKETEFGSLLQEALFELDIEVISQYRVDNYRIDFYLPKFNIAIEYDEQQHFTETNMKLDNCRQSYIENKIGAEFIRLDYRDSDIKNVVRVVKAVM